MAPTILLQKKSNKIILLSEYIYSADDFFFFSQKTSVDLVIAHWMFYHNLTKTSSDTLIDIKISSSIDENYHE